MHGGSFRCVVYRNVISGGEHLALIKGRIDKDQPVLVRMHSANVFEDLLGDDERGRAGQLKMAMEQIAEEGSGVVVILREPGDAALSNAVRRLNGDLIEAQDEGGQELRDYGVGAQILLDLGVRKMRLLSNTERNIIGLDGYGLSVEERVPVTLDDAD